MVVHPAASLADTQPMPTFEPGQIVTVFRNRLRDDPAARGRYATRLEEIAALADAMPGLVERKTFTADDGERVTLVTFADRESHLAWARHRDHRDAQAEGRDDYYATYSIQVCEATRTSQFVRTE